MSYPQAALVTAGNLTPSSNASLTGVNLAAAAADWAVWKVHLPIIVKRISFFVTTAVTAGTTAPQLTFYSRPTSGGTGNQVSLGVLTIPNAAAVGSVYYKDIAPVRIPPGYDFAIKCSLQATDGGTAAGVGFGDFVGELDPEYVSNLTKMIASA